jgi:hypothetical protein
MHTLNLIYDLVSCGILRVSSILAHADSNEEDFIRSGEACRLVVATSTFDKNLVRQLTDIDRVVCFGVGVGFGMEAVPLYGTQKPGEIREEFCSILKKLNTCNYIGGHERRPKIAIYVPIHNDTVVETLKKKRPNRERLENVFAGIMISDYFMECVKRDTMWYLFPADLNVGGLRLNLGYERYKDVYEDLVTRGEYTTSLPARMLMNMIL